MEGGYEGDRGEAGCCVQNNFAVADMNIIIKTLYSRSYSTSQQEYTVRGGDRKVHSVTA